MTKRLILIAVVALTAALSLVSVGNAEVRRGDDSVRGLRCVVAGVTFLIDNGLFIAAVRQQVDYDTIDSDSGGSEGLINTDLPTPSFLPLRTVIQLHYTNPELFDWCLRPSGK